MSLFLFLILFLIFISNCIWNGRFGKNESTENVGRGRGRTIKTGCGVKERGTDHFSNQRFLVHPRNISTTPFFRHLNASGCSRFSGDSKPLLFFVLFSSSSTPTVPISSLNDSSPHPHEKLEILPHFARFLGSSAPISCFWNRKEPSQSNSYLLFKIGMNFLKLTNC